MFGYNVIVVSFPFRIPIEMLCLQIGRGQLRSKERGESEYRHESRFFHNRKEFSTVSH